MFRLWFKVSPSGRNDSCSLHRDRCSTSALSLCRSRKKTGTGVRRALSEEKPSHQSSKVSSSGRNDNYSLHRDKCSTSALSLSSRRAPFEERSCTAVKQGSARNDKQGTKGKGQQDTTTTTTPKTRNNTTQVQDTTVLKSQPLPGDRRLHERNDPVRKLPAHINRQPKPDARVLRALEGGTLLNRIPPDFAKEPVDAAG